MHADASRRTMALSRGHARERVGAMEFVTVGFNALFGPLFLRARPQRLGTVPRLWASG